MANKVLCFIQQVMESDKHINVSRTYLLTNRYRLLKYVIKRNNMLISQFCKHNTCCCIVATDSQEHVFLRYPKHNQHLACSSNLHPLLNGESLKKQPDGHFENRMSQIWSIFKQMFENGPYLAHPIFKVAIRLFFKLSPFSSGCQLPPQK